MKTARQQGDRRSPLRLQMLVMRKGMNPTAHNEPRSEQLLLRMGMDVSADELLEPRADRDQAWPDVMTARAAHERMLLFVGDSAWDDKAVRKEVAPNSRSRR